MNRSIEVTTSGFCTEVCSGLLAAPKLALDKTVLIMSRGFGVGTLWWGQIFSLNFIALLGALQKHILLCLIFDLNTG